MPYAGEVGTLILCSLVLSAAGLLIMLISEWTLRRFAARHDFLVARAGFNLRHAWKPHVLYGTHRGRSATISYTLGHYLADGEGTPGKIVLTMPTCPPVTLRIRPGWPWSKRSLRTGDAAFDRWIRVEGSPKDLILDLLQDRSLRRRLRRAISPALFFTCRITLTRSGRLTLRHRSLFLTQRMLRRDLELLSDLADRISALAAPHAPQPDMCQHNRPTSCPQPLCAPPRGHEEALQRLISGRCQRPCPHREASHR